MGNLYPLLMLPGFDPRPWGTQDLSPIYPNHKFEEKIGEAWLSGDDCKVANGPLAGKTLAHLSQQYQRELVGDAARDPQRFPLLLKFFFPTKNFRCRCIPTMRRRCAWDSRGGRRNAGTWRMPSQGRRLGSGSSRE